MQPPTFSKTVNLRTAFLAMVIGILTKRADVLPFELSDTVLAFTSLALGSIWDVAAFHVKKWAKAHQILPVTLMISALALTSIASAQNSVGAVYDSSAKSLSPVASRQIGKLTHPLGIRFDVPILAFAGAGARGRLLSGVAAAPSFTVSKELSLSFGPALIVQSGRRFSATFFVGSAWKF